VHLLLRNDSILWCSTSDIEKIFMKDEFRLLDELRDSSIRAIAERVGAKIEAEADISADANAQTQEAHAVNHAVKASLLILTYN
jgi:hypothetical protein